MKLLEENSRTISILDLDYGPMKISTRISGIPRVIRRQWLLLIHQALLQLLNEFSLRDSQMYHSETAFSFFRQIQRSVSIHQAFKLDPSLHRNRYGFRIRLIRLHTKMNQKDMAKLLGTSRTHLSAVEHGKVVLRRSTVAKWENILRYYLKTDLSVPEPDQPFLFQADKRQTFAKGRILRTGEVELTENGRRASLETAVLRSVSEEGKATRSASPE